jgi:hypothetical protein
MIPVSCGGQAPPRVPEFRTPGSVPGLNSLSTADAAPVLDSSQRNIWWIAGRSGGVGGLDIWTASRSSVAGAWGNVRNEAALNSSGTEFGVTVEGDGLTIVFSSDRPGGPGAVNLWYAKRPTIGSPWNGPALVPGVNTSGYQDEPSASPDGTEMFFTADGPGTQGPTAIWTTTYNFQTNAWNPPTRIAELDTLSGDYAPAISADGMRLFFTSDRPGGAGSSDLYIARRTVRGQPWGLWRRAAELDGSGSDYGGCATSDGFSYYFSRNADLYRADRIYPRLLGPTSGGANGTATFTLRRDPGNLGLVAIGVEALPPTPAPPVLGDLLLVPLVLLVNATHDANGNVTFSLPIANAPGAVVRFQGMSQDPGGLYYLSNRIDFLHLP